MPFDLSNSLKTTCGWSFASKGMNGLFVSRFYTTAILTVMIIILVMILYPCQKNTPIWVLVKLGFYVFLVSLGMIFIHDCVVFHEYEKKVGGDESDDFIGGLNGGGNIAFSGSDDKVEVKHTTKKVGGDEMTGFSEYSGVGGDTQSVGGDTEAIFAMYGV
jgi:hypothetical protein